ncbi:MAG: glycerol acyltransferase [Sulfurovum sp. FS06-10]|jgi:1-acyl-sn-glycerol-3-phosphate acyltransferase|nr:MAG: glycerol acyltransferase [Sulfurovum sp. FS06-10]
MSFHKIKLAIYALFLTNWFGFKLKYIKDPLEKKRVRLEYAQKILAELNITVEVKNREKIPSKGQYLLLSNHRGIIDPLVVELALKETEIFGLWISKKELYNSPFFGVFVRNAGAILLDREKSQMGGFFADIKSAVNEGNSIFIFPEGTRNKSEKSLIDFKEGFRIIALKNKLPILPVFIRTHTNKALGMSLKTKEAEQTITIEIGDLIDYKEKANFEELYKTMFQIA